MAGYSNGQFMCYVLDWPFKYWTSRKENKMAYIFPVFKWHWNTRPFGIQPFFDHLNTKLVWYPDPHSICDYSGDLNTGNPISRNIQKTDLSLEFEF